MYFILSLRAMVGPSRAENVRDHVLIIDDSPFVAH
jgi:hypothetical protein